MNRTCEQIENEKVEKQKELKNWIANLEIVKQNKYQLEIQRIALDGEIKKLSQAISKGRSSISQRRIEIENLQSEYWSEKNQ